jgi:hypothetical protein
VREDLTRYAMRAKKNVEKIRKIHLQVQEMLKIHREIIRPDMINTEPRSHSKWEIGFSYSRTRKDYIVLVRSSWLCDMDLLRYWRRWEITTPCLVYPHTRAFTQY